MDLQYTYKVYNMVLTIFTIEGFFEVARESWPK